MVWSLRLPGWASGAGFYKVLTVSQTRVSARFLMDAVNEIKEKYGSVVNYCKQELGVTDEDIALMKAKYLE